MVIFLQLMATAANPIVRQTAAVMARKGITSVWSRLPDDMQRGIQAALLQRFAAEDYALAQTAVAEVIGRVASVTMAVGRWPELLPFLHGYAQAASAQQREQAMKLFGTVAPSLFSNRANRGMKPAVCQVLAGALADAHNGWKVKAAALETRGRLLAWLKKNGVEADLCALQASRGRVLGGYHLMEGMNPVYVAAFGGEERGPGL